MDVSHSPMDLPKITRKRKFSKNRNYKVDALSRALGAIKNGELGISGAARKYSVPKSTLRSHLFDHVPVVAALGGSAPALPSNLEKDLVDWLYARDEMGARVGWNQLASAVEKLSLKLNMTVHASSPHSKKLLNTPSSGWLVRFRRRHPNVPILRTKKEDWYPPSKFSPVIMQQWIQKLDKHLQSSARTSVSALFSCDEGNCIFNLGLVTFSQDSSCISISCDPECKNSFAQLVLCFSVGCIIKPMLLIKNDMISQWQKYFTQDEFPFDVMASDELFNRDIFISVINKILKTCQEGVTTKPTLLLFDKSLACIDVEVLKIAQENGILLHCFPLHSIKKQPHYFGPLGKILLQQRKLKMCNSEESKLNLIINLWQEQKSENWACSSFKDCGLLPLSEMYKEALQENNPCSVPSSSEGTKKITSDVIRGMEMALDIIESRCIDPQYLPLYREFFAKNESPKNDPMYSSWRELKLEISKLSMRIVSPEEAFKQPVPSGEQKVDDYPNGMCSKSDVPVRSVEGTRRTTEKDFEDPARKGHCSTSMVNAACELRDSVPISNRYKREFNFDSMPALNLEQHALEIMEQYQALAGSGQLQQLVIDADTDFEADLLHLSEM